MHGWGDTTLRSVTLEPEAPTHTAEDRDMLYDLSEGETMNAKTLIKPMVLNDSSL